MIKGMKKEIASGAVIAVGVSLLVAAAELHAPGAAIVGALLALGAGVFEAASTPRARLKRY